MPTKQSIFTRLSTRVKAASSGGLVGGLSRGGAGGSGFFAQYLGGQRQVGGVKRGTQQFLQSYNELPWYRAAVSKIAASTGGVEWLGLTEDPESGQMLPISEVIDQKHPLEIFLEQPHPYFSWPTIIFLWSVHLKTVGEAFGVWDDSSEGRQIWPIVPTLITELPTPDKPEFTISLPNGQFPIPVDQMLWLLDPDPTTPYARGSGIARALDDELSTDEEAAKTIRAFFENQARPDILITGKGLNPEKTKRIEEDWKAKQSGFWNAFKPHFMSEVVDIREFKQDFQSMQFTELRRYERDTIIQVFGIPPEIVGILQNSNRATIEAADMFFAKYTLTPLLNQMRESFNKQLVPKFDDTGLLELDYVSPVQEDKEYELAVMAAHPYAFLIDEIRVKGGEEALDDNKGQVFPVPMNIQFIPIDEAGVAPEAVPPVGQPDEPGAQPTDSTETPQEPAPSAPNPGAVPIMSARGRRVKTGRGYTVRVGRRR